jgi:hypothetical protein
VLSASCNIGSRNKADQSSYYGYQEDPEQAFPLSIRLHLQVSVTEVFSERDKEGGKTCQTNDHLGHDDPSMDSH